MIKFTGYIEVGGRVKYKNVSGNYQIFTKPGGIKSWSGSFEILSGEPPELGEGILCIDNGKTGKILISNISLPSSFVKFRGSGPIK